MADIVDDFLQRLQQLAPIPDTARQQLEQQVRSEWGGAEVYVRRHARNARGRTSATRPDLAPEQREGVLAAAIQQGVPLADAFERAGLCRSKGYAYLNRRSAFKA